MFRFFSCLHLYKKTVILATYIQLRYKGMTFLCVFVRYSIFCAVLGSMQKMLYDSRSTSGQLKLFLFYTKVGHILTVAFILPYMQLQSLVIQGWLGTEKNKSRLFCYKGFSDISLYTDSCELISLFFWLHLQGDLISVSLEK